MRRIFSCLVAALFALWPWSSQATPHSHHEIRHRIKRLFVIALENEGYNVTCGANSKAPYLSQTLTSQGVLLAQYYGTGHASLDNYIRGQAATSQTRSVCQVYADFVQTGLTPDGQAIGTGCVYPMSIKTLPDQLAAVGNPESVHGRHGQRCHTRSRFARPPSASVPLGGQYASRHDPFVYFPSIIDSPARHRRREPQSLAEWPAIRVHDTPLRFHHAESLQRRPRFSVPNRPAQRLGTPTRSCRRGFRSSPLPRHINTTG